MRKIRVLQLTSWDDALALARVLRHWSFRGHEDAGWSLTTKIERLGKLWNAGHDILTEAESHILFDFRRRAHHFLRSPPADGDHLQWLALVQHHGGPTRLLDVTQSFFAACFFAMEYAEGDACVWSFNRPLLTELAGERYDLGDLERGYPRQMDSLAAFANRVLSDSAGAFTPGIIPVAPIRVSPRLAAQQAGFLMPLSLEHSFLDNLLHMIKKGQLLGQLTEDDAEAFKPNMAEPIDPKQVLLVKVVLPRAIHARAVLDLEDMNVSSATLFPDLDGFARSLTKSLRVFDMAPGRHARRE